MNEQLAKEIGIDRELLERLVIMMAEAYEAAERHPNLARQADIMETGVLTVMKVYEVSR